MNKIQNNKKVIGIVILLAILALFPVLVGNSAYIISIAIQIGIFAIFAISYDLLFGYTGIVSFGHALFLGLGAYATGILMKNYGWSFVATLPVVIVVCLILGVGIGLLSVRVKDVYYSMMTLAVGQMFFVIASKAKNLTGGDDGFPGVPLLFTNKTAMYFLVVAVVIAVYIFARQLIKSPTGKVLQAIRENEKRTAMVGYDVLKYKLIIISISSVLAGIVGSLYVTYLGIAYPHLLHSHMTMQAIFMTVIGGTGTLYGPVIGSILVKVASTLLSGVTDRWMLIFGIFFVICVMLLPGGIASLISKITKKVVSKNQVV